MGGLFKKPKMPPAPPPPPPPPTQEDAEKAAAVTEAARTAKYRARGLGRRGTIITGLGQSQTGSQTLG